MYAIAAANEAAIPALPKDLHESALSTSCNKAFIPGRAGGFTEKSSPMACCVLDQTLAMAWILQSLLYCEQLWPSAFGARCNSEQAHFVKQRLLECCPLFRPFYDPCQKDTRRALALISKLEASIKKCSQSHGAPLLPGILASSTASPVRFPQTLACQQTSLLAARAFAVLSDSAATIYGYELGRDRTAYAKALMGVCKASASDALRCAAKIVAFFRDKMHSKLFPIGIRSDALYAAPPGSSGR